MSDRGVFVVAFTTVVLFGAGAFAIPQFFPFELLKSLIYVAIAIMVFFGENQYSYMLGILSPVVGWIAAIITGGFLHEFEVLFASVAMKPISPLDTPLHGLALIAQALLAVLCWRAWNKEVPSHSWARCLGSASRLPRVTRWWYSCTLSNSFPNSCCFRKCPQPATG